MSKDDQIGELKAEVERLRALLEDQQKWMSHIASERDQLKATVMAFKALGYAEIDFDSSSDHENLCNSVGHIIAAHDAEVIETWLKRLPVSNRAVRISDVRKSAQDYANQLRQQAKETNQ